MIRPVTGPAGRALLFLPLALALALVVAAAPRPGTAAPKPPKPPYTVVTHHWTNLYPALNAISVVSPTDAWAGGEQGHLIHFTGQAWTTLDPPELEGVTIQDLHMISSLAGWIAAGEHAFAYTGAGWVERSTGLGPDALSLSRLAVVPGTGDVYAVGRNWATPPGPHSALAHWDGGAWQEGSIAVPATVVWADAAFASATDGWIVGADTFGGSTPVLRHWNGATWSALAGPAGAAALQRVSVAVPGALWVTGEDAAGGGHIYRYAGGAWTAWDTPGSGMPGAITFLSPTDGWVATFDNLLHWDGTTWTVEYARAPHGGYLAALAGVSGSVWAVGAADTVLYRVSDVVWQQQRGGPAGNALFGVATAGTDEAWAVGTTGTLLHFHDDAWGAPEPGFTQDLYSVAMVSTTEGSLAGDHVIADWDGSAWAQVVTPSAVLYAVTRPGPGAGWAVGSGGTIWRDTAGTWSQVYTPVTRTLRAVIQDTPGHAWAGGGDYAPGLQGAYPVLLEYSGGIWVNDTALLPPGAPVIYSFACTADGSECWAAGTAYLNGQYALLHYANGVWALDHSTYTSLVALAPEALGGLWAVGYQEDGWQYQDGVWHGVALPLDGYLNALALIPGRGGWAVGAAGTILRYDPLVPGQRFYDVPLDDPFYAYIEYMADHGIISGYADNTFHPGNPVTRGQLTKMVTLGLGWPIAPPPTPTFADVPPTQPFYGFIEAAAAHGVISGYACGGPSEPCDPLNRPYFRPNALVTRAQLTKIIVLGKGWGASLPPTPTFADVPATHPFFGFVERAYQKGIISGYACGGPNEPCDPANRPYFRPGNSATRGQTSKILFYALTQP